MGFKFCPKCGKKEGNFIRNFCSECFLQDHKLIESPAKIQFNYCKRCDKIKVQRRWAELNSIELIDFIKTKIKSKDFAVQEIEVELEEIDEKNFNALIEVKGIIDSVPLILNQVIKVEFVSGICDSCMKISSDYFEATIQARFADGKKSSEKEKVLVQFREIISELNKKDPLARIVRIIDVINGFDLVLSSNRAAKISSEKIARKHNSKIIRSFSLVGVDKTGKPKNRFTYCVRF